MKTKKDRRTEVYNIALVNKYKDTLITEGIKLEDILINFFDNMAIDLTNETSLKNNKFRIPNSDLLYYFGKDDVSFEDDLIKIKFTYVISNKNINIVNTSTLKYTGKKQKNEGDEERQHVLIKLIPDSSIALLVIERVSGAITLNSLREIFNAFMSQYYGHHEVLKNALIKINPMPNENFLIDLSKTKRISAVKMMVDRDKSITDIDLSFSENSKNIRDIVELTYKPIFKNTINKSQVEKLYEAHLNNPGKIFRIIVEANGESGKIKLDTEGAKMAKYIEANLDINGLVDTSDIFAKFTNFIRKIPEHLLSICIESVAAGCEE